LTHAPTRVRFPAHAPLDDRVAVITGGESGIGLASARLFAVEGARVHLVGIDGDRLAAAAGELGEDRALVSQADVSDEDAVRHAIGEGVERFGRIDVLFSNAGISGAVSPIAEHPSDVFARVLAVHVLGAFHVLKHGAPHMPDGGSVIVTSSVTGLRGSRHRPLAAGDGRDLRLDDPARPPPHARGDRRRRALPGLGRQRVDDRPHASHRRRPRRLSRQLSAPAVSSAHATALR
jgi:NAD(P)-dependent dehydrogenase (short-subunit alcohol dehydrogenase family)